MDEEHLAAAVQLAEDSVAHETGRRLGDAGLDRQPVLGRSLDKAQVTNTGQGEIERPRNGRGRECQDVHFATQFLEPFLGRDAETLLLVDHDETKVAEADILAQEPMRPDDNVDCAVGETVDGGVLLLAWNVAREQSDGDRIGGEALAERRVVLGGENGRRHQDRHLLATLDGLEDAPECDFRLTVADIADHKAVHRPAGFHVDLHLGRDPELVERFLIWE